MADILVVDDSSNVRTHLAQILSASGHTIYQAENGKIGLEIAKEHKEINIIIADINMPVMSGLEMAREIATLPRDHKPSIIVLSSHVDHIKKEESKNIGVVGWIVKPYKENVIVNMVEKQVAKHQHL